MVDVLIDNPILNSPFEEPKAHYFFSTEGITDQIVEGRRKSTYVLPIPPPRSRSRGQLTLPQFHEEPRENPFVNALRSEVAIWRLGGYQHITPITRRLLEYWTDASRESRLFFCQIEALETVIYITEAARHFNDDIEKRLRLENAQYNGDLFRIAFKMATGSGKTVVMAMLIAWQALNMRSAPRDNRFTDRFLIVAPGITIRDRLRVLQPNETDNYYRQRDLVPADLFPSLYSARIIIAHAHQFQRRERVDASKTTKEILAYGREDQEVAPFKESFDQMVERVCGDLKGRQLIVINDEGHHCYKPRPKDQSQEELRGRDKDEKAEAKQNREDARRWFDGLSAVHKRLGVKIVYDLSATPFFLQGSGYGEGTIFPWVVSDFSLVDAIESGIVKIPRVPVTDNTQDPEGPVNRLIWANVRDKLPKKSSEVKGEPTLPGELESALESLYNDYTRRYERWEQDSITAPPVMIVVCNNTTVSNLVYRYIAGWEEGERWREGRLSLFSNVDDEEPLSRPNTILVDSRQLESGEALSKEFRTAASDEIERFAEEYRRRYPERSAEDISEADLLREVLNTVGKRGKLGENVHCVVSVSMLSEGWDANNVTHILGVRAFSTQLICEQVVGRGLRRMSYEPNEDDMFSPEYAEIYGVPFAFIPTSGKTVNDVPGKPSVHVVSLESRPQIEFPRVIGYRFEAFDGELLPHFDQSSYVTLSSEDFPTRTILQGITGAETEHLLDLKDRRVQHIQYEIARRVLAELYTYEDETGEAYVHTGRFPDILNLVRQWFSGGYLILKDNTSVEMLSIGEKRDQVVDAIVAAVRRGQVGERPEIIHPVFAVDGAAGSTRGIAFDTVRPLYEANYKCPFNFAVLDTKRWEQQVVQALEAMPEVITYVKNYRLGFTIPYSYRGAARMYTPDFIVQLENGVHLVVEVSGEKREDKYAKTAAARGLWVPAVNTDGTFGVWDFIEITDPYQTEAVIRRFIRGYAVLLEQPQNPLLRMAASADKLALTADRDDISSRFDELLGEIWEQKWGDE